MTVVADAIGCALLMAVVGGCTRSDPASRTAVLATASPSLEERGGSSRSYIAAPLMHSAPQCGNGRVEGNETCDDGNVVRGDGCSAICTEEAVALVPGAVTCVLTRSGRAKCWGRNDTAALGQGDLNNRGDEPNEMGQSMRPVDFGANRLVREMRTGIHSCARFQDATVSCWGLGVEGQLGITLYREQRSRDFAWGDAPGEMGDALPTVDLGTGRTANSVVVGRVHSCAILDDDTVKCWGNDDFIQLGVHVNFNTLQPGSMGDALKPVDLGKGRKAVQLVAGGDFNCALLDNNEVKCWGSNSAGQIGTRTPIRHTGPGTVRGDFDAVPLGSGQVKAVYAGNEHACAQFQDMSFKCWGDDTFGQLGTNDNANDCRAFREETPTTRKCRATPKGGINLGKGRQAKYLVLGYAHTCAHLDNDTVKCWGSNQFGELGSGHVGDDVCSPEIHMAVPCLRAPPKDPIHTAPGRTVVQVVAGSEHNCILYDDASIQCFGVNVHGQLGYGDTKTRDRITDEFVEY